MIDFRLFFSSSFRSAEKKVKQLINDFFFFFHFEIHNAHNYFDEFTLPFSVYLIDFMQCYLPSTKQQFCLIRFFFTLGLDSVVVGLNTFPKSINPGQPAQSAQADLSRNFLPLVYFPRAKGSLDQSGFGRLLLYKNGFNGSIIKSLLAGHHASTRCTEPSFVKAPLIILM